MEGNREDYDVVDGAFYEAECEGPSVVVSLISIAQRGPEDGDETERGPTQARPVGIELGSK
jgi:hypothetical protein